MKKQCNKCKEIKDLSIFYKDFRRPDKVRLECIVCSKIARKKGYQARVKKYGKSKLNADLKKWMKSNPEWVKELRKRERKKRNNHSKLLTNKYITWVITSHTEGLNPSDISNEMIEFKRTQLKLVRAIKDE